MRTFLSSEKLPPIEHNLTVHLSSVVRFLGPEYVNFHKWVKSDSYKVIPKEYWTAKNQHGKGMETAVIHSSCLCFNEWMKEKMDMEVVSKEMFEGFIDKMGTETHHFIHSCLIEGESVNERFLQWFDED